MEAEDLKLITQTVEGYPVADLKIKQPDNIIVGFVKDTVAGQANKGYVVVCCWRLNGTVLPRYGGTSRKDLYLDLSKINLQDKK